jgi:hypothetical protein
MTYAEMRVCYRRYIISPEFLINTVVRLHLPTENLALLMNTLSLFECCLLIHESVLELKIKICKIITFLITASS